MLYILKFVAMSAKSISFFIFNKMLDMKGTIILLTLLLNLVAIGVDSF